MKRGGDGAESERRRWERGRGIPSGVWRTRARGGGADQTLGSGAVLVLIPSPG